MKTIKILGIPFACTTSEAALELLEKWLDTDKNHVVVTPNPEGVMQARRNPVFREALIGADISLCDGTGIFMASRFLKTPFPERVRGFDTFTNLLERLQKYKRPITLYLLGGKSGVAEKAQTKIEARYTNIKIAGTHHGFFTADEEPGVVESINDISPDILLVCTGMPRAEIWAYKHRLINSRLTMCLGGTIDIWAGEVNLAPSFLRKIGLEWLYRLIKQPSRAKRMLDIPRFVFAVILSKITKNGG